ncbi:YolD-like family protein [Oceanobacillus sp. Castelsardo]|uniref:YolD-like family protein n=1 Tax=Oceanobacillus sp. Castelsardo TaxID=1851204 RepID=UPI000837E92F|nr:YolD-like family protein [Oceanobacillus sp. Castelsardo]
MSEVNDRGTIKWTAMMLPEHIQLLNKMWKDKEKKAKPMLDEQELEEINMKLQLAIHHHLSVEIKYYSNYDYKMMKGKIKKIDLADKYIQLEDYTRIGLMDILDVDME